MKLLHLYLYSEGDAVALGKRLINLAATIGLQVLQLITPPPIVIFRDSYGVVYLSKIYVLQKTYRMKTFQSMA